MNQRLLVAESLWRAGRDGEAERELVQLWQAALLARDGAGAALAIVFLAVLSLERHEDDRAETLLARVNRAALDADALARVFLVEARLSERAGRPPPAHAPTPRDPSLVAGVRASVAVIERRAGRVDAARLSLAAARRAVGGAQGHAGAQVELAAAEIAFADRDGAEARRALVAAAGWFHDAGDARAEGRAYLRLGEIVGALGLGSEPAAAWLARALGTLGPLASPRDRALLRAGFRRHGRRLPDHAMTDDAAVRTETLEQQAVRVRALFASLHDDALERLFALSRSSADVAAFLGALHAGRTGADASLSRIEQVSVEMHELFGAAMVERERLGRLVGSFAVIERLGPEAPLGDIAARELVVLVDADAALIARIDGASVAEVGTSARRDDGSALERMRAAIASASAPARRASEPPSPMLRNEAAPLGPTIAASALAGGQRIVAVVDRGARRGVFRESDLPVVAVFTEHLAVALDRRNARDAERRALSRLAHTVDAIRDGVLTLDREGHIVSLNATAARLLRLDEHSPPDVALSLVPGLAPLASLLEARDAERFDGEVVSLPQGPLVVSARPIPGSSEPDEPTTIVTLVELDRAQRLAQRLVDSRSRYSFHDVAGSSPAVVDAIRVAKQAAVVDASLLITGESGTGKEVFAQAVHGAGPRAPHPFVAINCAALPRDLLEAELFGYERGAFTGARAEGSTGKFEQAGEGTLLLDEIGDMPLDMQVKLLRVLQERVVVRLGGKRERHVPARIMATTHRDLDEAVARGSFRLDLLYRLRVLHIHLPPLRERGNDVALLAQRFVVRFGESQQKRVRSVGADVLAALSRYPWPGNIRELANVIEREVSLLAPHVPVLERLQTPLARTPSLPEIPIPPRSGEAPRIASEIVPLAEVERRAYVDAFHAFGGNVTRAAKALGVAKATFYAKLRQLGLHPADDPGPETLRQIRILAPDSKPSGRGDG